MLLAINSYFYHLQLCVGLIQYTNIRNKNQIYILRKCFFCDMYATDFNEKIKIKEKKECIKLNVVEIVLSFIA